MRQHLGWMLLLSALSSCVADVQPDDLRVYVLRERVTDAGACFEVCGEAPPVTLDAELCEAQAGSCELVAGWDRLRLIAYHGSFALDEEAQLPSTTFKLVVDDQELPNAYPGTLTAHEREQAHPRFSTIDLFIPPMHGRTLGVRAVVGDATGEAAHEFSLVPPQLDLRHAANCLEGETCGLRKATGRVAFTVIAPGNLAGKPVEVAFWEDGLRRTSTVGSLKAQGDVSVVHFDGAVPTRNERWSVVAHVEGFTSNVASFVLDAPVLALDVGCAEPSECPAMQGTGTRVIQVTAEAGFLLTEGVLEWTTDESPEVKTEPFKLEARSGQLVDVLHVPVPHRGTRWNLVARVGDFSASGVVQLVPPSFSFEVPGCPGTGPCTLPAHVGTLDVVVQAPPAFSAGEATLRTRINGLFGPSTSNAWQQHPDVSETMLSLNVPSEPGTWELTIESGPYRVGQFSVELVQPAVEVRVEECQAQVPCILPAGSVATIRMTAPAKLRTTTATLQFTNNGVASGTTEILSMDTVVGDERTGFKKVLLPAVSGDTVWQGHAQLAGFSFPLPVVTVAAGEG